MADPLFILAPHRHFTSVLNACIGQHPDLYGLPEMNLFMTDTMDEFWFIYREGQAFGAHGLMRVIAEWEYGSQTEETVALAADWIAAQRQRTTASVYHELVERAHPRILTDKTPTTPTDPQRLARMRSTFPDARFLHLLRHPRTHGESAVKSLKEFGVGAPRLEHWLQRDGDPQRRWYGCHCNILAFLAEVPPHQYRRVRGEDVLADPDTHFRAVAEWLGVRTDAAAIAAMHHPEASSFSCMGPRNAPLGNDINLLRDPVFRPAQAKPATLDGPVSWRPDGAELMPGVKRLAREFGYS